MSTVPEAIQARALGMEVAGLSMLTNWAAGLKSQPLHHAEVVEVGQAASHDLARLLKEAL
jgi:purine-nucleoside phosphorylase